MSSWIQDHLFTVIVAIFCYLLVSGAWRIFKHLRRKRAERKESRGRS